MDPKKKYLLALLCLAIFDLSAQEIKTKWGRIDPADLAMTTYASDTQASAVILSKVGWIHYDPTLESNGLQAENHIVIKLLKDEAIDKLGNLFIRYQTYRNFSRINAIRAQIHLPDGTIVKVEKSDMFDEKSTRYWGTKKIAFPKLVKGAIIEYEYSMLYNGLFQPVDWFFQDELPIRYAELKTYMPEWFDYVVWTQGDPVDDRTDERSHEKLYNMTFITSTFINKEVPALVEERYITTMRDYYSRVRFQLKSIQPPFGPRIDILNTWEKLAAELYEDTEWGGQLTNKRPGQLVLEAAGISPAGPGGQMGKAQQLYDFINTNIQWDKSYDFGMSTTINDLLQVRSGSSGEINKMLCAALNQAGIAAQPVLVSTRDNGRMIQVYPFMSQFNHMVILAHIDGKEVWIDAGLENLPLGMLREQVLNGWGWVVEKGNPHWQAILPPMSKYIYMIKGRVDANGKMHGDLECRFTGYHARTWKNHTDELIPFANSLLINGSIPLSIEQPEIVNAPSTAQHLHVKGKIVDQACATVTADRIYLNALFPTGMDDMPFKLDERTYPIEMNYPEETSMIISLSMPEGYKLETVNEPGRYSTENKGIQMTYDVNQVGNMLNISMKYTITQLEFPPEEYATLKHMFGVRNEKFTEQIILTKN